MPSAGSRDHTIPEIALSAVAQAARQLRLTILYHPQARRIGDVADLHFVGEQPLALSRLQLEFANPRKPEATEVLGDGYLSRQPLHLQRGADQLELLIMPGASSVMVDGQAVRDCCCLDEQQLNAGVVLMLARRIVLLLHSTGIDVGCAEPCAMVGESEALQRVREQLLRVAGSAAPVLILGESGTGKELLARALHSRSERSQQALVAVNMAAIPAELAASELFGVSRGAFTGADADREGFFSKAHKGSLFLDEIGACPVSVQPQLLRALQEGEIQAPGGAVRRVDVRVIAATDAQLDSADLQFSAALRHRLGGFEIHLPALRERREDLGRLLRHLLPDLLSDTDNPDAFLCAQWAALVQDFARYSWPGNVRELGNFCQQISVGSSANAGLVVPANILCALQGAASPPPAPRAVATRDVHTLTDDEVLAAMTQARWEISRAARKLEISRQALYRRIEEMPQLRVAAEIPVAEVEAVYHACAGELELAAEHLRVSRTGLRRRWRALDLVPQDF